MDWQERVGLVASEPGRIIALSLCGVEMRTEDYLAEQVASNGRDCSRKLVVRYELLPIRFPARPSRK